MIVTKGAIAHRVRSIQYHTPRKKRMKRGSMRQYSASPDVAHRDARADGVNKPLISTGLTVAVENFDVSSTASFSGKEKRYEENEKTDCDDVERNNASDVVCGAE